MVFGCISFSMIKHFKFINSCNNPTTAFTFTHVKIELFKTNLRKGSKEGDSEELSENKILNIKTI